MPRTQRPGPKTVVEGFLTNELNNRANSGFEESDHKEYVREARQAVAAFKRLIVQEPQTTKKDERYRTAAKNNYAREGEVEIDGNATISYGDDDGAYVSAWVWVSKSDLPARQQKFPSGD